MLTALALALGLSAPAGATPAAWTPTAPGVVEVKAVPTLRVMEAEAPGTHFDSDHSPFRPLFRYLQTYELAMTTPVEVDVEANRMRFVVDPRDERPLESGARVEVSARPGRTVVSVGLQGSYSKARFLSGVATLQGWLADNPHWDAVGGPVAVYWNSPFVPGPLKRSEVHIPVEPAHVR